jgi:hypothetical protein
MCVETPMSLATEPRVDDAPSGENVADVQPAAPRRARTVPRRAIAAGILGAASLGCVFLLAFAGHGSPSVTPSVGVAQSGWLSSADQPLRQGSGPGAPAAAATAVAPAVAATASLPNVSGEATAHIPSAMGLLVTSDAPPGHRVFVNGRAVGYTPRSILVRCGTARVKVGSGGRPHVVDVPCGQEIQIISKP